MLLLRLLFAFIDIFHYILQLLHLAVFSVLVLHHLLPSFFYIFSITFYYFYATVFHGVTPLTLPLPPGFLFLLLQSFGSFLQFFAVLLLLFFFSFLLILLFLVVRLLFLLLYFSPAPTLPPLISLPPVLLFLIAVCPSVLLNLFFSLSLYSSFPSPSSSICMTFFSFTSFFSSLFLFTQFFGFYLQFFLVFLLHLLVFPPPYPPLPCPSPSVFITFFSFSITSLFPFIQFFGFYLQFFPVLLHHFPSFLSPYPSIPYLSSSISITLFFLRPPFPSCFSLSSYTVSICGSS